MPTISLDRPVFRTVTVNLLLAVAAVALPALSHAAAFPLYRFEPMRLLLFTAIVATGRRNALLLALWLPLLSLLTSGHPAFPKVLLIQGELALNTLLFFSLVRRTGRFAPAAGLSILASKAAYYGAKFLLLKTALMSGELVATAWIYQLAVCVFILLCGAPVYGRRGGQPRDPA